VGEYDKAIEQLEVLLEKNIGLHSESERSDSGAF
jgi:hypothetical protein